ncbi:MAG: T9SS type A sorting domain-containing protein [Flavobacteriales bacterium]|nr:T9SS type A sorting domain-containing protein [Flavobacteriales bacterium]
MIALFAHPCPHPAEGGLPRAAAVRSSCAWRWPLLVLLMLAMAQRASAQASNDPSDATPQLAYTSAAGITNAIGTGTTCTNGSLNGSFTMVGATSTTTVAMPACGNFFTPPPAGASPAADVWFRIDPPATPHRFRINLLDGTMTNGAIAVYEAPSASGPFRLLECAVGGSLVSITSFAQPTVEANCYTSTNKLYIRVWDEQDRSATRTFYLCVQGQQLPIPARGSPDPAETPCPAPTIAPHASTFSNIDYVFACNEEPWLFADSGQYVGGDLWLKLTAASGSAALFAYQGAANVVKTIGLTAYITSDCNDHAAFRQVGHWSGALAASHPTGTPAKIIIRCLPPGTTVYVRIHSAKDAQDADKRYGRLRFRWNTAGTELAQPANTQPCGAIPLSPSGSCPTGTTPVVSNFDVCNTPGIPYPACGSFDGNSRDLWYSFTAPPSGTVHLEASPAGVPSVDPAMALYTTGGHGCNGRFTLMDCDDRKGVGYGAAIIRTGLIPGQTYYVRVWGEGAGGPQGSFTVCLNEPVLPAGHCFYVMDLWARYAPTPTTYQGIQYQIDGGTPVNLVTATGDEASQLFLFPVPIGSSLFIQYFNNNLGEYRRSVYQLGDTARYWRYHGGIPVAGPTTGPTEFHTISPACNVIPRYDTDCLGARTICAPNTVFGDVKGHLPPGNTFDLNSANMGCLSGTESKGITWLIFRPVQDGTVAFWFDGTTNAPTTDVDFAIWDAGPAIFSPSLPNVNGNDVCAPQGPPVRCSSARRNNATGLMAGVEGLTHEGTGGWGWLSPLPVLQDHLYVIALVRGVGSQPVQYQLRWTQVVDVNGVNTPGLLGCTPMILPMELLFLEAEPMQESVLLKWATGSEKNSSHFVVERSTDGMAFAPIGQVQAAGNTQQRTDYAFVDHAPHSGVNYYRLQLVDQDASSEHSNVVAAVFGRKGGELLLFPNPTTTDLYATWMQQGQDGPLNLRIVDVMGRLVMTRTMAASGQAERIATEMLPAGAYQVSVADADGQVLGSGRFVRQ